MAKHDCNMNCHMLTTLHNLIQNWENEVVEFKQASNSFSQHEIGQYFSAISNEANLKGLQYGWLVFGVHNKTRKIVSTDYRDTRGLELLKHEVADNTTDRITFTDILEVYDEDNRVVMFKIPASVTGMPTAWKGHWYGREGESIGALSTEELDRLRGQARRDWSMQTIRDSSVKHLDNDAIHIARENYKCKHNREHISVEIDKMNDEQFLTKLKLVKNGELTNAAMILLGNPDHDNILESPARVMWRLYGSNNMVKDYHEYNIPFITVVDRVFAKVRNLTYRFLPDRTTLFPTVTDQYDMELLKELMNNCIAHQAYNTGGRIYFDEFEDMVVISNPGSFIPGDVRSVLQVGYRAPYYRNQLLSNAMRDLDMIDTVQMGILRVYNILRERYFPLPDYDLQSANEVSVKVYGKIIDENYTRLLFDNTDLPIETVFLLDRIQKRLPLEKEQYKDLKKLGFIDGKVPYVYVSATIADLIDERAQYTKNKAMDDKYYMDLIVNYLQQWGSGTKRDFIRLLNDKLPDILDDKQKEYKIKNYLTTMKREKIIEYTNGNHRTGEWVLVKK